MMNVGCFCCHTNRYNKCTKRFIIFAVAINAVIVFAETLLQETFYHAATHVMFLYVRRHNLFEKHVSIV